MTQTHMMTTSSAVVFDAGSTIFSEDRIWRDWATWIEVEAQDLLGALDEAIKERRHHTTALCALKPGFDLDEERRRRAATGYEERFEVSDIFPDALPTIRRLKDDGYTVGIVGNHPRGFPDVLRDLEPRIDFVASSAEWEATKPDPAFFTRVVAEVELPAERIAYVGDRLDNDVLPAIKLGMLGIFVRRGRWASVHRRWPEAAQASAQIDALDELPDLLPGLLSRG